MSNHRDELTVAAADADVWPEYEDEPVTFRLDDGTPMVAYMGRLFAADPTEVES